MLPKYEVPQTDDIIIQYDTNYTYDKYCELKKLVYDEIHEKKIPLHWSNTEILYNAFMFSVYLGMWGYCFYYANNLRMILLGVFSLGFGGLIFHEACHFAPFKNQKINRILCKIYPFANADYWSYNHNYLHHSFTNTEDDFDTFTKPESVFRILNATKLKWYHKYQFIYPALFFIGSFFSSNHLYFSMRQSNKVVCCLILYYFGLLKTMILFGTIGLHFGLMSQLSHIQYECIQINTENKNDFLYNQTSSSMSYLTNDPITRFLCLGLDIQLEHHIFPNLPNTTLRQIKHTVRRYCEKNDFPYMEKSSVFPTIYSYIYYLYKMGNP